MYKKKEGRNITIRYQRRGLNRTKVKKRKAQILFTIDYIIIIN